MPVKKGGTGARARSLSRSSSTTSATSTMRTNSGLAAEQRRSRERRTSRQPGWEVEERVRLEKNVVEQTLRVSQTDFHP